MWNALESLKFRKSKLDGNINSTKCTDFFLISLDEMNSYFA